jgi:signal transduction histidine kinase
MVTSFLVLSFVRRMWSMLPSSVLLISGINLLTPSALIPLSIFLVTLGWTFVLASSANAQRWTVVGHLAETNYRLKRELVRLNANYRQLQKGVGRVLHGPVQDAVAAAVYKMGSITLQPGDSQDLVRELRERISLSLAGLNAPSVPQQDVRVALADLAELWDGVVDIDLHLDAAVTERFADYPVTAATIIELIRELCSNAVRHGDASTIRVQLLPGADLSVLEIDVSNDGKALTDELARGIGSQLLEELSLSWSRVQEGEFVRVRASVPVL